MNNKQTTNKVIIIGAGIVGATMGTLLKQLEPEWQITLFERLGGPAEESSNEWNNAGTGHASLCELNYTTENKKGSIDINKAIEINEQFEVSLQYWSYLVQENIINNPEEFIRPLPHVSFVWGKDHVDFLKRRFNAMSKHPLFESMEYSEDPKELAKWMPLIMEGRNPNQPVAGSKINSGTDVSFGEITRKLINNLEKQNQMDVRYNNEVLDLKQMENGAWEVKVRNFADDTLEYHTADSVFIGAGGNAIPVLQKTKIPESKHIGGFPISGEFLVTTNPQVVRQHDAKVYGKEPKGEPPMIVPHLDRRYMKDKNILLFGPFASFGPKFLKKGSNMDFLKSIKPNNILTMLAAGAKNIPLIKYSINQVLASKEDQMKELRNFVPDAKDEDWDLLVAGKRVQVIKDMDDSGRGTILFGTEIVQSEDLTLTAVLGESPGASTSVSIILDVLKNSFPQYIKAWEPKIKEMVPSYGESLAKNKSLLKSVRNASSRTLKL